MFNEQRFNGSRFNGYSAGLPGPRPTPAPKWTNYSLSTAISGSDGTRLKGTYTETGWRSVNLARQLRAGTTDLLIPATWTIAGTQALYLLASTDLTLKTNSATTPADTIVLKAGKPLVWEASGGYYPNPFTTDVTAIYCSCAAAVLFQGAILTI